MEAEAVAYMVLKELGLPSTAPAYIARHGGSGKSLLRMVKRVCASAESTQADLTVDSTEALC